MDAVPAVLFDVDGTLVDSNYLHIHAWCRAFDELGLSVEAWRIHRCIGMDGSRLVAFLTGDAQQDVQRRAKELHGRYFTESAGLLRRLPGARELLERIHGLGLRIVLATSAGEEELELLRKVLDSDDLISAMTSSKDVEVAKPEPGIIQVALDRAGVEAADACYVGDAVWDILACKNAGLRSLGVLSGGVAREELQNAGAEKVFDNAQEMCQRFDDTGISELRSA
ncbi:HAD family hydrolase [Mycolicibacterium moriokaense]|nr:HAD family hydrolase [Mycolicibacterium moriokaense]